MPIPRFHGHGILKLNRETGIARHGHPQLKEHPISVTAMIRAAPNWDAFKHALVFSCKKRNEDAPLALGNDE